MIVFAEIMMRPIIFDKRTLTAYLQEQVLMSLFKKDSFDAAPILFVTYSMFIECLEEHYNDF